MIVRTKVPIETNNTLFLQGSEILKSENSMLEKNQNGADHAITIVHFRKKWNFFFGRLFGIGCFVVNKM